MRILSRLFVLGFLVLFLSCGSDTKVDENKISQPIVEKKKSNVKNTVPAKTTKPKVVAKKKNTRGSDLSASVDLKNIDYKLIDARLFQKINAERKRLGLITFKNNNNLKTAAKIHNDYLVREDVLDHSEVGTSTPELKDRVDKGGGSFRTAGENIQYEGFIIRTTNGVESIVAPTYEELAEQLWQNWKTSPPHYKNLTNPEFKYLGTALKWSDAATAVFATQVYGG